MIFLFLYSDPPLPNIPYHNELKAIFPYNECKETIEWRMESATFPRFIKMLSFPPYKINLLRGIIFSVGGLSESLVNLIFIIYYNTIERDSFNIIIL